MLALAELDWVVMALYGAVVVGIGWRANRRQKSTEDYFLGGRRLRWWLVAVSLVATSFSSASLIGGTGFGFLYGLKWIQLQIGDLIALIAVCAVFLPFFSKLSLTTAYEYLEKRFGVVARTVASSLFLGQTLLRAALLIYAPALALATILRVPVPTAILVSAAAAILYSSFGGISAVVWTDLIQMCVIVIGVTYCIGVVFSEVPGGMDATVRHAMAGEKLEAVTVSADRSTLFNLLGTLVPYMVFAFSLFGTGQQAVQRFLSVKDLRSARRSALLGWSIGTLTLGLTLTLGVFLASWAHLAPGGKVLLEEGLRGDQVLPKFVETALPGGMAGLMLAAIFAASMSSLDSAIHSMSTCVIVDFRRRFFRREPDPKRELLTARITTGVIGVIATIGALVAAGTKTGILLLLVTWLGFFAGPLLGLFLLGMLTRRANEIGAVSAAVAAFAGIWVVKIVVGDNPWGFHALWFAPASCAVTVVLGSVVSRFYPAPSKSRLEGLTLGR